MSQDDRSADAPARPSELTLKGTQRSESAIDVYQQQVRLFEYYSGKIYSTRLALISATVGAAAYVLEAWTPSGSEKMDRHDVAPYLSAVLGYLWLVEMGYFKKYNRLLMSCALLERDELRVQGTFFLEYRPFTHRWVYGLYLISSSLLFFHGYTKHPELLWTALPTFIAVISTLGAAWEWSGPRNRPQQDMWPRGFQEKVKHFVGGMRTGLVRAVKSLKLLVRPNSVAELLPVLYPHDRANQR